MIPSTKLTSHPRKVATSLNPTPPLPISLSNGTYGGEDAGREEARIREEGREGTGGEEAQGRKLLKEGGSFYAEFRAPIDRSKPGEQRNLAIPLARCRSLTSSSTDFHRRHRISQISTFVSPKSTIVDIDAADIDNELAVVEYEKEIYKFYEVPEYELNPLEFHFWRRDGIAKGMYQVAKWNGTKVTVKILDMESHFDPECML